jgi:hypothetical protein
MDKNLVTEKVPIDIDRCLRVSEKVLNIIIKKTHGKGELYCVVRMLCLFLEIRGGFKISAEDEAELRRIINEGSARF